MHQWVTSDYLRGCRDTGPKSLLRIADSEQERGRQSEFRARVPLNPGYRFLADESGQTTMLISVFVGLILLGFVALGLDVGYLFHEKRMAQSAADAAAIAAAEEATAGNSLNEQNAANAMAKMNGFDPGATNNPAIVNLSTPTSGNYSGASTYIQVTVSKPISTFFLGLLNPRAKNISVAARAVAGGGQSSPTCICLEGQHGTDFAVGNNGTFVGNQCGVVDDSDGSQASAVTLGQIGGGGSVSALALGVVSSASISQTNGTTISSSTAVVTGLQSQCQPTLPPVPTYTSSQCTADPLTHYGNGGSSYTVGPNSNSSYTNTQQGGTTACYNSLTIGSNNDTVTINPGIYVINGGELHFVSGGGSGTGSGVFFYLVGNASLVIDNGANVNLTAPTNGTYSGDVIFQDPSDTQAMNIQGGANTNLSGIIYAPTSNVTLANGTNTVLNADFVANTLTIGGGETLKSYATSNLGTLNLSVAKLTE